MLLDDFANTPSGGNGVFELFGLVFRYVRSHDGWKRLDELFGLK